MTNPADFDVLDIAATRKVLALQILRDNNDAEIARKHLNGPLVTVDNTVRFALELESALAVLKALNNVWSGLFQDEASLPTVVEATR